MAKRIASQQDRQLIDSLAKAQQAEVVRISSAVVKESRTRPSLLASCKAWLAGNSGHGNAGLVQDPDASKLKAILETQVLEALTLADQPQFFVEDALDSIEAALDAVARLVPVRHAAKAIQQLEEAHRLLASAQPDEASAPGNPYDPLTVAMRVHRKARKEARLARCPDQLAHLEQA